MIGWQPIETAPKDGTHILVWFKDHMEFLGPMQVVYFDAQNTKGNEWRVPALDAWFGSHVIAKWMPLPEPPVSP